MNRPPRSKWQDNAACTSEDPDLFHAGERDPEATKQARSICNRCPVRTACLLNAYAEHDQWGIRAGFTPRQRNAFLRKAGKNVARAVADALETTTILLQQIYRHHAKPTHGGHVVWTDHRKWINVRGKPYTVHQLAWIAHHGIEPIGHVQRSCDIEDCVAKQCLTDRWTRDRATAGKKPTA